MTKTGRPPGRPTRSKRKSAAIVNYGNTPSQPRRKLGLSLRVNCTPEDPDEVIQNHLLFLRKGLIATLHNGENYYLQAECPQSQCGHRLSQAEIIKGLKGDPSSSLTECPACHYKFEPKLMWATEKHCTTFVFYSKTLTLRQLKGLQLYSPGVIKAHHPLEYRNAIAHFGILGNAFKAIDIKYPYPEVDNVKEIVFPFLGKLPDVTIADLTSLGLSEIRELRNVAGIKECTNDSILEEAQSY